LAEAEAAERTTSGELPAVPVYTVERARVPLVLKLFGVTALLIAAVVGIAVAITIQRASTVARETVNKSIAGAARLFDDLEKQRLTGLSVPVQLLGNDSSFYAYIRENYLNPAAETQAPPAAQAAPPPGAQPGTQAVTPAANQQPPPAAGVDLVSLNDQIEQRRQSFGSDVLVLLDDQGRVITRTDQPSVTAASGEDLYEQSPIVKKIIDDPNLPSAGGVVVLSKRLYHAAIAPVAIGTPPVRIAYLLNAAAIDEGFANRIAESTKADVLFMAAGNNTVTRSAPRLDEGTIMVSDLRGLPPTVGEGDPAKVIDIIVRVMKLQEAEVLRQEGEVREVIGHRLVSVFRGERGIIHAIRASRAINEELATHSPYASMTIGVGIATGEFVSGSVELSRESGLAMVGNAPLLALLFASHAPSGSAYISYETAQAAGGEVLSSTTREEVRLKWLTQPLPVASLPLVSVTTGVIRAVGGATSIATLKLGGTMPGATAPGKAAAVDLAAGQVFASRYRIEQVLGRGGMGVVYKASDTQLDEIVAIKTLPGDVMQRSPEDLERFKREIRLARKITHRNVLRTFDYGEADGLYFISMEFVRGYTLSELLGEAAGRQMAPRVAMGISRQISRGLQAAHEQGIIHRDIKPQNVLIDAKGEVKLMDFGIARMTEAAEAMTQAGLIVGTPHYMSPEQVQGKQLDPRSDVYSMGVLMYEMLVGRRPFESTSLTGVLTAHITETPRPAIEVRPEIGERINAIVMRCMAKDPKARYADAGVLLAELDTVQISAAAAAA